jgi:hypothetical protein
MQKSFFPNEYRIIEIGTNQFESYDLKSKVDAVPFIVVRDDDSGEVKYADKGAIDGTTLRQIERRGLAAVEKVFNLKEARAAHAIDTWPID